MSDDCLNPDWSPSYGYQQGCRCDRCRSWRREMDLKHRDKLNAYKRRQRSVGWVAPEARTAPTSDRSTTTFYNDVLDWWDGL